MALPSFPVPVARASGEVRTAYLQRVLGLTFVGLTIAAISGIFGIVGLLAFPEVLGSRLVIVPILGLWAVTNFVARPMVFGEAKWAGFILGTAANGLALSFLLTIAILVSQADLGNPFTLIGLAMGLTAASGTGMAAYAFTRKRDFSMIGAGLAALSIPMLILMAVGIAFPSIFSGTLGLGVCVLFVLVSAAGLLYQLNSVIHEFSTDMHIEGAFTITIGVLVLFWNILSLLLRLRRN